MSHSDQSSRSSEGRSERIREVIDNCIARRMAGEAVADEALIAAHPELMPELADALKDLRTVEIARELARTVDHALRIRCPHCHNHIELVGESPLSDIVCPSCGSHISLVDTEPTFHASPGEMIGQFQLIDKLGAGAFGTVWSARDTQLDRMVALKMPRRGQFSSEDAEKFIREARAAAQLSHPHIVRVLEVGRHEDRVYIAYEYVKGLDLADWLTDSQPTFQEAADVCATLADALQHAHDHGVIHRDLKPSNVMLDADGEPHLMDFGLAKRVAGEITMTVEGQLLGTPAYMSPEQARGASHDADARSDIYSLGVILFELLTGERPFRGNTRMLLYRILNEDAPAPRKLNTRVPHDLETICLKCLEKDPNRRYATARELSQDLNRYLVGEPIHARPVGRLEKAWRWGRRNPTTSILVIAIAVTLVTGSIVSALFGLEARRRANEAEQLLLQKEQLITEKGKALASENEQRRKTEWALYAQQISSIGRDIESGNLEDAANVLGDCRWDLRNWEYRYMDTLLQKRERGTPVLDEAIWSHHEGTECVIFSPDGSLLLAAGADGQIVALSVENKAELFSLRGHPVTVNQVAFRPDGKVFASAGADGVVKLWDVATQKELATLTGHSLAVEALAFAPNSQEIATASWDRTIRIWDPSTGKEYNVLREHDGPVTGVRYSPDGKWLVTCSKDETVRIWNASTYQQTRRLTEHQAGVRCVAWNPVKPLVASGGDDNTVILWDVESGEVRGRLQGHTESVLCVLFSHDGQRVFSGSADNTIRCWSTETGQLLITLRGHASPVMAVTMRSDAKLLASTDLTGIARLWPALAQPPYLTLAGHAQRVQAVSVNSSRSQIVTGSADHSVRIWESTSGRCLRTLVGHADEVRDVSTSPIGDRIASASVDKTARIWEAASTTDSLVLVGHTQAVNSVTFAPNGSWLATASSDMTVRTWSAVDGHELRTMRGHTAPVRCVDISSDGLWVLSGAEDATIRLWDAASGAELCQFNAHAGEVRCVVFWDTERFISAGIDHEIIIWDIKSRKPLHRCAHPDGSVRGLAIDHSTDRLFSSSSTGVVRLWSLKEFSAQQVIDLDAVEALALAFDSTSHRVILGCSDNMTRVIDLASDQGVPTSEGAAHAALGLMKP